MKRTNQQGLIKMIIIIIVAVVILSLYGVDLKNIFMSEQVQRNFHYIWNFISGIWDNYLAGPFMYFWGIWVKYIWDPFMEMLKKTQS